MDKASPSTVHQRLFPRKKTSAPQPPSMISSAGRNSVPKSPTYIVAENKVITNGEHEMRAARKLLRPVSQELTKIHPDYADIFQSTHFSSTDNLFRDGSSDPSVADKENVSASIKTPSTTTKQSRMFKDGINHSRHASVSNDIIPNSYTTPPQVIGKSNSVKSGFSDMSIPDEYTHLPSAANLVRSHSVNTSSAQPAKIRNHRRQSSVTSRGSIQEHVIFEDPREHLYNVDRNTPFSNYQPTTASLPLQSTFEMDYSMNLTYAQLAEYRRNHRLAELKQKTGNKLKQLEAEISASSTVPKSPFDRQNLGSKSSNTNSVSSGSSDTGVSTSKKKKAPAPPTPQTTTNHLITEVYAMPEPLVDYDMTDSPAVNLQLSEKLLPRRSSSASTSYKLPAPQPLPKSMSSTSLQESASSIPDLQPNNLSTSSATLPKQTSRKNQSLDLTTTKSTLSSNNTSVKTSIDLAREQLDALKKLQELLKQPQQTEVIKSSSIISNMPSEHVSYDRAKTGYSTDTEADHDEPKTGNDTNIEDTRHTDNVANDTNIEDTRHTDKIANDTNIEDTHERAKTGNDTHIEATHERAKIDKDTHIKDTQGNHSNTLRKDSSLGTTTLPKLDRVVIDQSDVVKTKLNQAKPFMAAVHQSEIHQTGLHTSEVHQKELHQLETHQTFTTATDFKRTIEKDNENVITSVTNKETQKKVSDLMPRDVVHAVKTTKLTIDVAGTSSSTSNSKSLNRIEDGMSGSVREYKQTDACISSETRTDGNNQTLTASHQNEKNNMKTDSTAFAGSVWRYDDKLSQLGDFLDQEDRSSITSMDMSKRSSTQSEDMSIGSSNTSQRVFSPDWAPEYDLDSDDDIMDEESASIEKKFSNEGFKPSIIPAKISDMKEGRTNTNSKKNENRNERTEAVYPFTDENIKFGSIRNFKNSMRQGMKNIFGSISKASGGLLPKEKSQDFLDSGEGTSQGSAYSEDDASKSGVSSNWTLSRSNSGHLRRVLSDSIVSQTYLQKTESSKLKDNSENEIRDINFAIGVNNNTEVGLNSNHSISSGQEQKLLKRAGVAYMNSNGQIIVFPDEQIVQLEDNDRVVNANLENGGHIPVIQKKHERRHTSEVTVGVSDKSGLEEALERLIYEKELQYKAERLNQQEIENKFRRLKDIEDQEHRRLLQRNSNTQESRAQLQNELAGIYISNELNNNNNVNLLPLNNLTTGTNGLGRNSVYVSTDSMKGSPYMMNNNGSKLQSGYLDSQINIGHALPPGTPIGSQLQYSAPSFPTSTFGHQIGFPNILSDPLKFPSHPTSFVDGRFIREVPSKQTIFNLTQQERAYLSSYMHMIGVAPPTNEQQWATLLGSFPHNSPDGSIFNQLTGLRTFPATGYSPDLSSIFKNLKTLDSLTPNQKMSGNIPIKQSTHPWELSPVQNVDATYQPLPIHNSNIDQPLYQHQSQLPATHTNIDQQLYQHQSQLPATHTNINGYDILNSTQPNTPTSQESFTAPATKPTINRAITAAVSNIEPDHHISRAENETSDITFPNFDPKGDGQTVNIKNITIQENIPTQNSTRTTFLPSKLYGTVGYRPVSFQPGSTR